MATIGLTVPADQSLLGVWAPVINQNWTTLNTLLGAVRMIGDGTQFTTAGDIGDQANAAYADLPAQGGTIRVMPSSTGGRYDFSTPIVFDTLDKYVRFESAAPSTAIGGGCTLNWTPSTGTAITLDYADPSPATPNAPTNHGLRNIFLINNLCTTTGGCGGSAVGIEIGNVNGGAFDATMEQVCVVGFGGFGYVNTNIAGVDTQWISPFFEANAVAIKLGTLTEKYFGGTIAGNGRVLVSDTGTSPEVYMLGVNMFGNGAHANGAFDFTASTLAGSGPGYLYMVACHQENSQTSAAHFVSGVVNIHLTNGVIEDDNATGTGDWMISCSGYNLHVDGLTILSQRPYTNVFLLNSPSRSRIAATIGSPGTLSTDAMMFGGANSAFSSRMFTVANSANPASVWEIESPLILDSNLTIAGATPTGTGTDLGLGVTTGFGTGAAGTAVTTTTKGGGTGPTTPETVVKYLEVDLGGVKYWLPLVQ